MRREGRRTIRIRRWRWWWSPSSSSSSEGNMITRRELVGRGEGDQKCDDDDHDDDDDDNNRPLNKPLLLLSLQLPQPLLLHNSPLP